MLSRLYMKPLSLRELGLDLTALDNIVSQCCHLYLTFFGWLDTIRY